MSEARMAWEELKRDSWDSTILCFHEDLMNWDVKNKLMPMLKQKQVQDVELHWVEPETMYIKIYTSLMGGLNLTYYLKMEQIAFERGMHAVCFSFTEEVDKGSGLGGLLGGFMKPAVGQSYLQMVIKEQPMLRVKGSQIIVDLDQWPAFRQACQWSHQGKIIGNDLNIQNMGMVNRCLCLKFSWRTE